MRVLRSVLPKQYYYLFILFFSVFIFLALFRFVLLLSNTALLNEDSQQFLLQAIILGFRYDTVINSYILLLPFLLLTIDCFARINKKWFYKTINIFLILVYSIVFIISASDIPYFSFYNSRIIKAIFGWSNKPGLAVKAVFSDKSYYPYILLFLVITFGFIFWITFLRKRLLKSEKRQYRRGLWFYLRSILLFLMISVGIFFGMRGETVLRYSPISLKNAFFCDYSFINQLGLNPVYNLLFSFGAYEIDYFDTQTAIKNVQNYLNITPEYDSPIARKIEFDSVFIKPNIVVVLMESMSAVQMGRYGNEKNLTPFLDKIASQSLVYNNIYTAGIHTHNGIFSTLFALPTVMSNHPMVSTIYTSKPFAGMSYVLAKNGYQTIFLCTNNKDFDNMGGFLKSNNFHKIISEEDYPRNKLNNGWGVADHYMFEFSIDTLNRMANNKKPFFAVYMTISTHTPHIIPKDIDFSPKSKLLKDQIYEYADWSIDHFLEIASKQAWFDNTVFVFIADHGQNFESIYDLPLSYHQTPLIFYSPKYIRPAEYDGLGLQIDLFPTLMGLIKIPYINNTMGVDLGKEKRPFVFFTTDDKIGCLNEEYFLTIRNNGKETLNKFKVKGLENYIPGQKALVDSMKNYTYSMLQTTQWLVEERKAGPQTKFKQSE